MISIGIGPALVTLRRSNSNGRNSLEINSSIKRKRSAGPQVSVQIAGDECMFTLAYACSREREAWYPLNNSTQVGLPDY